MNVGNDGNYPNDQREELTVFRAVDLVARRLADVGIDESRLEARILVSAVTGLSRARLISSPDRPLTDAERARLAELVARRETREPLAYVVGRREFFGLDFAVDSRVLVPRPETELLVEEALCRLNVTREVGREPRAVDVGTGSGAIAVSLAVNIADLRVDAVDRSPEALEVARDNARRHGVEMRIRFVVGDLLDALPGPYDLIAANLPYVAAPDVDAATPEVRREPRLALDGGPDGLDVYRRLLRQAPGRLTAGGSLLFEIAADQGPAAASLAAAAFPTARVAVRRDYAGLDRLVLVDTRR